MWTKLYLPSTNNGNFSASEVSNTIELVHSLPLLRGGGKLSVCVAALLSQSTLVRFGACQALLAGILLAAVQWNVE